MKKVIVYHQKLSELTGRPVIENGCPMFVAVAEVKVGDEIADAEALEHAWRWTNNVDGSWSAGERNYSNPDYNPNVKVVEKLYVDNEGKEWGHRSSMVGDHFGIANTSRVYKVAAAGFVQV